MLRHLTALFIVLTSPPALAGPERYVVDPGDSSLNFIYTMGDNDVRGSFPSFGADILVDFDSVSRSSLDVTIDATRAKAGLFLAQDAMTGPDVLHVKAFPVIRFRSTDVRLGPAPTVLITGDLTIRDVTRPIEMTARLLAEDAAQMELKERLVVDVAASFSRSAFGAGGFPAMVEDEMRLEARIAVTKAP